MALGVVRSLGARGVPIVLMHYRDRDFAQYSRHVSVSLHAPHPEQAEKEFIDFLLEQKSRYPGAVIFPTSDESLVAVSRHKELLDQHFRVASTCWDVTKSIIDKHLTYSRAGDFGVAAPRTFLPRTMEEARAGAAEIGLPCLIKPCQSHLFSERFHRKMIRVRSMAELEQACSMSMEAGLEIMVQEIIPGNDLEVVNYNSYVWEGKILAEFTAIHVRNGPPWVGPPRVVVSRRVPEVIESGRRLMQGLKFNGYACTEFKRDARDGKYKVLDVNGRHNLSTLLAVRCGIDFPWLHYRHLTEGILPEPSGFREEVYWIDMIRDVGYSSKYLIREKQSLIDYLRPYFKPHVFAIFDVKDMKPFIRRLVSLTLDLKSDTRPA